MQYVKGRKWNAVSSLSLQSQTPLWNLSFSCRTEVSWAAAGQRCRRCVPGVGTGTQSHAGCRPVCKTWEELCHGFHLVWHPGSCASWREGWWGALCPPAAHSLSCRALLLSLFCFGNFPPWALGWQIASLVSRAVTRRQHRVCTGRASRESNLPLSAGVWKGFSACI